MSEKEVVELPAKIKVGDLAEKLNIPVTDLIKTMMSNGVMATVNELLDYEIAAIISEELGRKTSLIKESSDSKENNKNSLDELEALLAEDKKKKNLKNRPPIVTVLGHVDHGKTTLLDTLKQTKIADKEAGGITQHISSYQVKEKNRLITFIDTPGHEAFQAMRERGASLADIAVLVIAADDGVKPQTEEVINFVKEHQTPLVVAINKIDKPNADVNRVKQELAERGILVEGYGGDVPVAEISAKKNINLDTLLDTILLLADIHELKADYDRDAVGVILESKKDPRKGILANVIIKTGTLKVGENVIINGHISRIRKIENYLGQSIEKATPSMPITIYGLTQIPGNNEILRLASQEEIRKKEKSKQEEKQNQPLDSSTIINNINAALMKKYSIILKADTHGTLEALEQVLKTIQSDEITLKIISSEVGPITEKDVQIAQTDQATIYGFNIYPTESAKQLAQKTGVSIKNFQIIYELIEDVKEEMSERLEPEIKRTDLGRLKVLAIFKTTKKSMIVGGKVTNGKMVKGKKLEIIRDKTPIGQGELTQLQHNKEDVQEVKENFECGLTFSGTDKIQVGDTLICFQEEQIKRKI